MDRGRPERQPVPVSSKPPRFLQTWPCDRVPCAANGARAAGKWVSGKGGLSWLSCELKVVDHHSSKGIEKVRTL